MKAKEIKKLIKNKYGTMSRFAKLAGIDRLELQKDLNTRTMDGELCTVYLHKIDTTEVQATAGEIPAEMLEVLKSKIEALGGVVAFADANPDFSIDTIYQVLNGRRKRMTPIVKSLFDHFSI